MGKEGIIKDEKVKDMKKKEGKGRGEWKRKGELGGKGYNGI